MVDDNLGVAGDVARWLASSAPWGAETVATVETHISRIYLVGSQVYKLKKPVKYDFLDFSSVGLRERACRDELRLNRRLAPGVYRRVVPVTRESDGDFRLGGTGEVVDWLVEMERLPADRTLESLHRRGQLRPHHVDELAELLVKFYSNARRVELTAEQYRARCLAQVAGNLNELMAMSHHLPREIVERVHGFQLQLLRLEPGWFDHRVEQGHIVDGHGDLRPEHICFANPLVIFDCIEFRNDFRELDCADELAFLSAECDFIGAAWVEHRLLDRFQSLTGDHPSRKLVAFYKAYRASVRAKVAALRADQLGEESKQKALREATIRLNHADQFATPHLRPLVLVVGGLSGTGKTTLARKLAEQLSARLFRTDVIRQELLASGGAADAADYSVESRMRVYREMFQRAIGLHVRKLSVVFDGTFSTAASIREAYGVVIHPRAVFLAIECHCRPETARRRITKRLAERRDASEATPGLHDVQKTVFEPWPAGLVQCKVDTEQPVEDQLAQVYAEISRQLSLPPRTTK